MKTLDMTKGRIIPLFLRFAFPLMLGDLFQQLYIAVDSAIVGKFAGGNALAAVGSTTFLIRLMIGLFVGISAGASVVIAQAVGAKEKEKLRKTVHTMVILTIFGGIVLSVFSVLMTKPLLQLVTIPQEIKRETEYYLMIYFAGTVFDLIYNVFSGILRSFGDSKRPFLYLTISSVVNIILDYLFIAIWHWGVAGAALATILSQMLSAILITISMCRTKEEFKIEKKYLYMSKELIPEILRMGLPAGFQSMIIAVSNVIIQAHINGMGTAVVGGFGVFNKIDGLIMLPTTSLAVAAMTFTAQNYGAGEKRRIVEGIKVMFGLQFLSWLIGAIICLLLGNQLFTLFTDDEAIIYYAKLCMWYDIPCYWAMSIGYAMTCVIRGMGRSHEASIIFISTMCIARQIWILIVKGLGYGLGGILISYPVSWLLTVAVTVAYALYLNHRGEFSNQNSALEMIGS